MIGDKYWIDKSERAPKNFGNLGYRNLPGGKPDESPGGQWRFPVVCPRKKNSYRKLSGRIKAAVEGPSPGLTLTGTVRFTVSAFFSSMRIYPKKDSRDRRSTRVPVNHHHIPAGRLE